MTDVRSGDGEVLAQGADLGAFDDLPEKNFIRNVSFSGSTVSGKNSLTTEQAHQFLLLMRRQSSSATNSESVPDFSIPSAAGDFFLHETSAEWNGGPSNGLGCVRKMRSGESELAHIQEGTIAGFDASSTINNTTNSPAKMRKRSSKNKLIHTGHVPENSEERSCDSPPTDHVPIQRAMTGDSSMRVLVGGHRSSPMAHAYECYGDNDTESEDQLSSGEFEGINASRTSSSGTSSRDEGRISYPVQRDYSVENGQKDKMILCPGRGSITLANVKNIENFNLFQITGCSHTREQVVADGSVEDGSLNDRASTKREEYSRLRAGNTCFSSPNLSPRHTGHAQTSPGGSVSNGLDGDKYQVNVRAFAREVDPEQSLVSPAGRQQIHQSRPNQLDFDFTELSISGTKRESESSAGTVIYHSDASTTPSSGGERYDGCALPNNGRVHLSEHSQGIVRNDDSLRQENWMGSQEKDQNEVLDNPILDSDVSETPLDPHIFANHPSQQNFSNITSTSSLTSNHTHQSSISDSEASASFPHGHAHQSSLSDSDFDSKGQEACQSSEVEPVKVMMDRIDELQELHKEDLTIMRNRGKLMTQQTPLLAAGQEVKQEKFEVKDSGRDICAHTHTCTLMHTPALTHMRKMGSLFFFKCNINFYILLLSFSRPQWIGLTMGTSPQMRRNLKTASNLPSFMRRS